MQKPCPPVWMTRREREGLEPGRPVFSSIILSFLHWVQNQWRSQQSFSQGLWGTLGGMSVLLSLGCVLGESAGVQGPSCVCLEEAGDSSQIPLHPTCALEMHSRSPLAVDGALHASHGTCSTFVSTGGVTGDGGLSAWCWRKWGRGWTNCRFVGLSFPVLWHAVKMSPAEHCWSMQFLLGR